jgi:hypothetical protein
MPGTVAGPTDLSGSGDVGWAASSPARAAVRMSARFNGEREVMSSSGARLDVGHPIGLVGWEMASPELT